MLKPKIQQEISQMQLKSMLEHVCPGEKFEVYLADDPDKTYVHGDVHGAVGGK
jgi:hypothetical protein